MAPAPTESLPPDGTLGFRVQKYGLVRWRHLFNARQLLALSTYARFAREFVEQIQDAGLAEAVNGCVGLVVDRLADLNAALCGWQLNTANTAHVFVRWALPMNWDYGEVNPLAGAGGSPESAVRRMTACVSYLARASLPPGHVEPHPRRITRCLMMSLQCSLLIRRTTTRCPMRICLTSSLYG